MRVVVTGATGNVGTSVLDALDSDPTVESVVGMARSVPAPGSTPLGRWNKVEWIAADVASDDLVPRFRGADAVVHLAWLIQPSRDADTLYGTNVTGSGRVFRAAGEAHVGALVYASSIGAYSPGPKDEAVTESWPTGGVESSFYSCHKATVERMLDEFSVEHPEMRVVRLRPGLIFKREAATRVKRLFFGTYFPGGLVRPSRLPVAPRAKDLVFQVVHTSDVAEAYRLAVTSDATGAFNIATDPVVDGEEMARALGARPVRVPLRVVRAGADLTWRLRLQPTPAGWVDMAMNVPVMDTSRARRELGWSPRVGAAEALVELLEGIADGAEGPTPALARSRPAGPSSREARAEAVESQVQAS